MREYVQTYKWCFVPECTNTTIKTPDKLFITVPKGPVRLKWLEVARRDVSKEPISPKSTLYCCEDHFNLEDDLENYMFVKFNRSKCRVKIQLKPHSLPSRFECQKPWLLTGPSSPKAITKRKTADKAAPTATASPAPNKKLPNGLKGKTKTPDKQPSPSKKAKPTRKMKPFSNLFDDVVFVISGFVNPQRSDIRNKALAMGAKYKADWDKTCTHLICAFANTPKFREVKGRGKIVRKEWIENSYSRRMRIPWRRYALDKNDECKPESEEEIYDSALPSGSPIDNRKRVHSSESEEDSDEEVQRVLQKRKALQLDPPDDSQPSTSRAVKLSPAMDVDLTSDHLDIPIKKEEEDVVIKAGNRNDPGDLEIPIKKDEDVEVRPGTSKDPDNDELYDADTDVGEDFDNEVSESRKLPYLPEFFDDATFYICKDLSESSRKQLRRYIIAHKGTVLEKVSDEVEYFISESPDVVKEIKDEYPQLIAVKPEWVWRSHDENRVFPTSEFEL